MKKVFSVVLSLFTLLGVLITSCSADAESGGGAPNHPVPKIKTQPQAISWTDGEPSEKLSVEAEISNDDGLIYQWYKDGTALEGATSKEYTPSAGGSYYVLVSNAKDATKFVKSEEVLVTINPALPKTPTPEITKNPESVQWEEGSTPVLLTVEATISSGTIAYQWYKEDGTAIEGATSDTYQPTESGSYYVVVSNADDSTKYKKSSVVTVVIIAKDELLPPTITGDLAESVSYDKASDITTLSITATATEGADIYYQWFKDGKEIDGETSDTYQPTAFGSYYCKLYASKDDQTSQPVNSKTIVISESRITATVSVNTTKAYTNIPLKVTVTYNVEAPDVKYQWVKKDNNSAGENVPDATSETFTPTEEGKYYCKVTVTSNNDETNSKTVSSDYVEVTVKNPTPKITQQPEAVSWTEGETAKKLSVVAEISNDDGLIYQWYKDGTAIPGATSNEYTPSAGGLYYVVVSNAQDDKKSVTSNQVRVTINPAVLPEFDLFVCNSSGEKKEVTDITYDTSEDFPVSSFYVKSTNYKETEFSIVDVSLSVKAGDDYNEIGLISPKIEAKPRINAYKIDFASVIPTKEADYKIDVCASPVSDSSKQKWVSVNVTVKKGGATPDDPTPVNPTPEITEQPTSVQWEEGSTPVPLTVKATISSGTIAYQWYKDGNLIPDATSSTYTPNKDTGNGSYYVVVSNADDPTKSVKSSAVSVVITAKGELLPPTITGDLAESVSYDKASQIKTLSITANATEGADIYYLWYKDGTSIGAPSKDASTYAPTAFGSYYCALYASKGVQASQTVNSKTIVISESGITATVSVTPTSAYTDNQLEVTVKYNVEAADLKYQWVKTDNNSGADVIVSGATSATYTPTEAGKYYCKVTVTSQNDKTNSKVVKSAYVEVTAPTPTDPEIPTISSINEKTTAFTQTVKEGSKLELTVDASVSDGGTLTYAWYESKSASSIGTGATYSKANVTSADAGEYYVTVTNTLNGNTKEASSFRVKVEISSQDIGSGSGGFDFN
ncbi:MAG: hypothetical protein ACI4LT_04700 [Treponema sp.]